MFWRLIKGYFTTGKQQPGIKTIVLRESIILSLQYI